MTPQVDLIIAIHDPSRPLARAVRSALDSGLAVGEGLRITVVCHNTPRDGIEALLDEALRPAVTLLELHDGIPSPSGPFMLGMQSSTAQYVSIMGSDDWLEPGALRAWLDHAVAAGRAFGDPRGVAALIAPQRHASGARVRTPPVRPWRRGPLDAHRDRLVYRTAPLGLIRRDLLEPLDLRFPAHLRSGEDMIVSLRLWFSGEPVVYGRGLPDYVVGADAVDRVTLVPRTVAEELRCVLETVSDASVTSLRIAARRGIVAKMLRVHVFSTALARCDPDRWTAEDRYELASAVRTLLASAPGVVRLLSFADRRALAAIEAGDATVERLAALLTARRSFARPGAVLTPDPRGLLAAHGPVRFAAASFLL